MRHALVVGAEVVSAPTIDAPSFEAGAIVLSGDFTEDRMRRLVGQIGDGEMSIRPVLVDLGP